MNIVKGPARGAGIPILAAVAVLAFSAVAGNAFAANRVVLPVEVAGDDGTVASVTVYIPPGLGKQVRSLWMQIHGLAYAGMASVRINQGPWRVLNNQTVAVAEPARSYGGIGGGFATVKMVLSVPAGEVVDDSNTIRFRFNFTDGMASGFRVLAFNLLTSDGRRVLPQDAFVEEDPNSWVPPFSDSENLLAGQRLWDHAQLTLNDLPGAPPVHAHCSDCHASDGRDLKYFNFSNASIVARARFHGLSELQGRQIASYIRNLPGPHPGRPWNPPYQPGPGLDAQPIANWAAGAGLGWVLDDDSDTLPLLFATMGSAAFRPDSNLNQRELPIAFQLPDWNHWLPRIHPLDFQPGRFETSAFFRLYRDSDAPDLPVFFDKWSKSRSLFLTPHLATATNKCSAEQAEGFYSAQLWQLVKTWEMSQKLSLEDAAPSPRLWLNTVPAAAAPAEAGIPNGPCGMGRSALTNEYFNNAWYQVQLLVNSGNHRHHERLPVDWVYVIGHFLDLEKLSGLPEPGRLLIAVAKAMQSTDPAIGPGNYAEGWRPERNIDPRILVSKAWEPVFTTIPAPMKQRITEMLLRAWLDKTTQYPAASYFVRGLEPNAYKLPPNLQDVSGGRVWEASAQFRAAGVSSNLLASLDSWGKTYTALAELFHY